MFFVCKICVHMSYLFCTPNPYRMDGRVNYKDCVEISHDTDYCSKI